MDALAAACAAGTIPAEIALVISDREDAHILESAREKGLVATYVNPGPFRTKLDDASEEQYIEALQTAKVDLVVLAGFMRILKGKFLQAFQDRVINIHPSLLPAFTGLEAWKQALDYGVKITGCTAHLVDQGVDTGTILGQTEVPVQDDDDSDSLHARIQKAEWALYPEVIARLLRSEFVIKGRRARRIEPEIES